MSKDRIASDERLDGFISREADKLSAIDREDMERIELPLGLYVVSRESLRSLLDRAAETDAQSGEILALRSSVEDMKRWIKDKEWRDDQEQTDEILEDEEQKRSLARLKMRLDTMEHTLSHGHLLIHADNPDSLHNRVDSLEMEVHNLWANREDRYEDIKLRVKKIEAAIELDEAGDVSWNIE